jgi:hypothetical protein
VKVSEEMERALLAYFVSDNSDERPFQSLATIFEMVKRPGQWRETFFRDIDGVDDKMHLKVILDQMVIDGLLQIDWAVPDSYRVTEEGAYESVLGIDGLVPHRPSIEPIEFDSENWTGARMISISAKAWHNVKTAAFELQTKAQSTNFHSEFDKQDIQELANALVAICLMANPELPLIDKITSHPKFQTYTALFVFVATIRGALGI